MDASTQRARGMLLGLAVGDVLGGPVEGWDPHRIQDVFGSLTGVPEALDLGALLEAGDGLSRAALNRHVQGWRPRGIHSDDTQQALALACSLVACGGVDVADVADRLYALSRPRRPDMPLGVYRGFGRGFSETFQEWDAQSDPRRRGRPSAGNGAAMRIAPLGFFLRESLDQLPAAAVDVSLVTHREVRALAAAATVAHAVAVLSRREAPVDPVRLLYDLIGCAERVEQLVLDRYGDYVETDRNRSGQLSRALCQLDGMWRVPVEECVQRIGESAGGKTSYRIRHGNEGFCLCSVPTSILYLLRHIDDLEAAVLAAVNGGGDADTIAAMTGAMAGALHGAEAIPAPWLEALRSREMIEQVATALADPGAAGDLPDLHEAEMALTLETNPYRTALLADLADRLPPDTDD